MTVRGPPFSRASCFCFAILRALARDTGPARYACDLEGRRIAKRVYSSASGGVVGYTRFVYRGAHVGFESDSAGTIGMKYAWGLNIDDLIAFEDGAGNHYYVAKDKLGSIRNVATRSGTWVMRLRHRPYGTLIDSVGTGVMLRYRWTGREWDAELGWYFMWARYYDPVVSRFTQEDPIGFAGGDNLLAYVGGSPLEARDPNGLKSANVDTPFEGFCFSSGACVNWDGSLNPSASGWSTGGGGGWLSDSYLNQTRAEFEARYEISIQYNRYRDNYDELKRQADVGNLDPVVAELFRTGKPLEKGDWERFAKEVSKTLGALGQVSALDITLSHLLTGRLAINDSWLNLVAKEKGPAATYEGFTAFRRSFVENFNMRGARLANVLYHEALHATWYGDHCSIYREANRASGFRQQPAASLGCTAY